MVITGATSGIGEVTALRLAECGARIVFVARDPARATATLERLRAAGPRAEHTAHLADLSVIAEMKRVGAQIAAVEPRIDVLINNAGGLVQRAPIETITDELFDQVINLNVRSTMVCTGAAAQHMRKQGSGGAIINVTSVAARHGGGPGASLYAGSKGFVSTITHGLAKELVKDKIRVNAVAPGVITTPFHDRYSTPQMLEGFKASIPMNRLGTADECAGAFLFLASEQLSGYMTGQILEVNGGQYMP